MLGLNTVTKFIIPLAAMIFISHYWMNKIHEKSSRCTTRSVTKFFLVIITADVLLSIAFFILLIFISRNLATAIFILPFTVIFPILLLLALISRPRIISNKKETIRGELSTSLKDAGIIISPRIVIYLGIIFFMAMQSSSQSNQIIKPKRSNYNNSVARSFSTPSYKPVIYLYPERETKVNVKLDFDGELTVTYPRYKKTTGWQVTAQPNGDLIDSSGKYYSYLFWEGPFHKVPKFDLSKGSVVAGMDTASFLEDALKEIGLTPREANEFIVFWLPKMEGNQYNQIYFAGTEYSDAAKLTINPKPDSILRVFMVFIPLEQPTFIKKQKFMKFERKGFTVVEWGGTELTSADIKIAQ